MAEWQTYNLCKVTRCTGHVLANTRLHQLYWGDRQMYDTLNSRNLTCAVVFGTYTRVPYVAHAVKATHSVNARGVVITVVHVSHTLIHI